MCIIVLTGVFMNRSLMKLKIVLIVRNYENILFNFWEQSKCVWIVLLFVHVISNLTFSYSSIDIWKKNFWHHRFYETVPMQLILGGLMKMKIIVRFKLFFSLDVKWLPLVSDAPCIPLDYSCSSNGHQWASGSMMRAVDI